MDAITILRIAVTVVSMICFVALVAVAYSKWNAPTMEAMGQSIIDDQDYFEPESQA